MSFRAKAILAASVLFISFQSQAGRYFDNLRVDQTVPAHCQVTKPQHFMNAKDITYFTVGIDGAKRKGFDYEYPANRKDMDTLYRVFKNGSHNAPWFKSALKNNAALRKDYQILLQNYETMGFELQTEGEILEVLALKWIQDGFNEKELFVTGSVVYHQSGHGRTIGELDLMVASMKDCRVLSIGEAKLGIRSLGKARRQLNRFSHFLKTTITPFLESAFNSFQPNFNI